jgi:hypothetical protein
MMNDNAIWIEDSWSMVMEKRLKPHNKWFGMLPKVFGFYFVDVYDTSWYRQIFKGQLI